MNNKIKLYLLIFCVLIGGTKKSIAQTSKRPNIIFIVTDDQHRDQFNFLKEGQDANGNKTNLSPNIDKLAEEGAFQY